MKRTAQIKVGSRFVDVLVKFEKITGQNPYRYRAVVTGQPVVEVSTGMFSGSARYTILRAMSWGASQNKVLNELRKAIKKAIKSNEGAFQNCKRTAKVLVKR